MRIMQNMPGRRMALALGLAALLAGCETGQSLAPEAAINTNQVRSVVLKHDVVFAGKTKRMSKAARRELAVFLSRAGVRYGDHVVVSTAAAPGKQPVGLARTRLDRVGRHMRFRGVRVDYARHPANGVGANIVRVSVERSVVIAPDCPDWDTAVAGAALEGKPNRFGCMNAAALASMVADPNDLNRGRRLENGDAEYQTRWLRNYRAGKAKKPVSAQTQK
jgi:pilus assembly protein CpaD